MISFTLPADAEVFPGFFRHRNPEETVFFDIETTGFVPSRAHVYLIGAAVWQKGGWQIRQWLAEKPSEETGLLRVFAQFLRPFRCLVTFNGNRFDIPFLKEKYESCGLDSPFGNSPGTPSAAPSGAPFDTLSGTPSTPLECVDLYQEIRPLRQMLSLAHLNQKALEQFLGTAREDCLDGGALIKIYRDFVKTGEESLSRLCLLHNLEDVRGMLRVTALLPYRLLLEKSLPLAAVSARLTNTGYTGHAPQAGCGMEEGYQSPPANSSPEAAPDSGRGFNTPAGAECPPEKAKQSHLRETSQILQIRAALPFSLPVPVTKAQGEIRLTLSGDSFLLEAPFLTGTFFCFFPSWRDYYYFPALDQAIHKSVARFSDPAHRVKATPDTCYIKTDCSCLPQSDETFSPALKRFPRDDLYWLRAPQDFLENPDFLTRYASHWAGCLL